MRISHQPLPFAFVLLALAISAGGTNPSRALAQDSAKTKAYYDWAYNRGGDSLDLSEVAAKRIAELLADAPDFRVPMIKSVLSMLAKGYDKQREDVILRALPAITAAASSDQGIQNLHAEALASAQRKAQRDAFYSWAFNREGTALDLDAPASNQIADLLMGVPASRIPAIKNILSTLAKSHGKQKDTEILRALPALVIAAQSDDGLRKMSEEVLAASQRKAQREAYYSWAFNRNAGNLDLDEAAANQIADLLVKTPDSRIPALKEALSALATLHGKERDQAILRALPRIAAAVQTDAGLKQISDEARATAQAKARLEVFRSWAYNSQNGGLDLEEVPAQQVAALLARTPEARIPELKRLLSLLATHYGKQKDAEITRALPAIAAAAQTDENLEKLIAETVATIQAANRRQALYSWAFNRENEGLDLDEAPAKHVAELLAGFPDAQIPEVKRLIRTQILLRAGANPRESEKHIYAIVSDITAAKATPDGFAQLEKATIAKMSRRDYLESLVNWASSAGPEGLGFSHAAAALAGALFESVPNDRHAEIKEFLRKLTAVNGAEYAQAATSISSVQNALQSPKGFVALQTTIDQEVAAKARFSSRKEWLAAHANEIPLTRPQQVAAAKFLARYSDHILEVAQELLKLSMSIAQIRGSIDIASQHLDDLERKIGAAQASPAALTALVASERDYALRYQKLSELLSGLRAFGASGVVNVGKMTETLLKLPSAQAGRLISQLQEMDRTEQFVEFASIARALDNGDPDRIKAASETIQWVLAAPAAAKRVLGCVSRNAWDGKPAAPIDLSRCIDKFGTDIHANAANSCGEYTLQGEFVRPAPAQACENPLLDAYRPFVKRLPRSAYLYHYVEAHRLEIPSNEKVTPQDPRVARHAVQWSDYFWDKKRANRNENTGLYTASDPLASRANYGGGRPVLYRIELPAGSAYLKIDSITGEFSPRAEAFLKRKGCEISKRYLFHRSASLSLECLALLQDVVAKLGIVDLTYPWGSTKLPGCPGRSEDAHILLKVAQLGPGQIRIFTPDQPPSPADREEAAHITQLFETAGASGESLWNPQSLPPVSKAAHNAWKGAHLIGCEQLAPVAAAKPVVAKPATASAGK